MLPSFYVSANSTLKNNDQEYNYCIESKPCKGDGKSLKDYTEKEQHEIYHCRVKRHIECSTPPRDDE